MQLLKIKKRKIAVPNELFDMGVTIVSPFTKKIEMHYIVDMTEEEYFNLQNKNKKSK